MSFLKQLLLCAALVAAAAGGWYLYQNPQTVGLARETAGPAGQRQAGGGGGNRIPGLIGGDGAVNVVTAAVATDEGGDTVIALGTAKAARSVTLYPQVTGMVTEVLFSAGQEVEAGTVLLRLEDDEQAVAVDRARVALEQARAALQRSQALAESRTISNVALSDAETAVQLAEIEVRTAEIDLRRRSLTAPFAGTTGLTDISVGDLVTNTSAITTLEDLSTLRVTFEVPERWTGRIAAGQAVAATAQGWPGSEFPGRISGIDNRIDATTRTLRLEAEIANEGEVLKTGMAITVMLRFDTDEQLAVPTLAVQWDRRGSFVWKIVEGAARRAEIAIVSRQSGAVIVQGALAPGEKIVVEGVQRLREGAKVAEVDMVPAIAEDPEAEVMDGEEAPAEEAPSAEGGEAAPAVSGTGVIGRARS